MKVKIKPCPTGLKLKDFGEELVRTWLGECVRWCMCPSLHSSLHPLQLRLRGWHIITAITGREGADRRLAGKCMQGAHMQKPSASKGRWKGGRFLIIFKCASYLDFREVRFVENGEKCDSNILFYLELISLVAMMIPDMYFSTELNVIWIFD